MPLNKDIKKVLVHRLWPHRHRPGRGVRLRRHPGLPGPAGRRHRDRAGQLQPRHHHDRQRHGGPDLHRAPDPHHRQAHHREGKARQHPLRLRRPDGPDPLHAAGQGGLFGEPQRAAAGRLPRDHRQGPRTGRSSRTPWRRSASPASPPKW